MYIIIIIFVKIQKLYLQYCLILQTGGYNMIYYIDTTGLNRLNQKRHQ